MSFHVQLEQFDGPLHVLLEIIQGEKLPITEVSLSKVTEDYVRYINEHEVPPSELADFLVVATKLLLIKSQAILPISEDEAEDSTMLALQLRLYQEFVDASQFLEKLYNAPQHSFERMQGDVLELDDFSLPARTRQNDSVGLATEQWLMVVPRPAEPVGRGSGGPHSLTPSLLHATFQQLLQRLKPFFQLQQSAIERVVSVQERLREIQQAILGRAKLTFSHIACSGKSKIDIVVSFLALLELIKQRIVSVVQTDTFHDIEIKRVE